MTDEMSPLPFDHPVMMVQKTRDTLEEEQGLSPELLRGAKKTLGAANAMLPYRETKFGIRCGMDWLGEIRSCKRKDASGEHESPYGY